MRVVVIGGTGHIGSYLVPRLVRAGHEVVSISRGQSQPYLADDGWAAVTQLELDKDAEEQHGTFGERVAGLRPDAVVDLLCYTMGSATHLAAALRRSSAYLLHCGTIWVLGPATAVPVTEDAPRRPILQYGVDKAAVEEFLLTEAAQGRLRATVLHPGHVVGPGWLPVNPAGYFRPGIYGALARGEEVALPHLGLENHLRHSPCISMAKAARLLGYAPRYSSLDALHEAVTWLAEHGQIEGVTR